jgi:threonine synthase
LNRNKISYYSTNLKAPEVSFREALLRGLAPDGGLYMPTFIPVLGADEILSFSSKKYFEIACHVLYSFLKYEINSRKLWEICEDSYNFPVPVEKVSDEVHVLRLDQGPTASFKDFAARLMARLMNYYISADGQQYTIITATSGDTGSAVASAFHGLDNIDVIILFPKDEVTETQRKQMTTLGGNIKVIAVDGKFDDCQRYAKRVFSDSLLSGYHLSSANSINIGRLLPQSVYYFYAWSRIAGNISEPVVFSVPSGNYGNLLGGIIAREMGLPVEKFIISTNLNNEVPEYLRRGIYEIINPSINCISSAMNVGHPSNLCRIIALYGGIMNENGIIIRSPDLGKMRNDFFGTFVTDEVTLKTISDCFRKYNLLLEPHGAVAWKGLESYLDCESVPTSKKHHSVSIETAHPAKFSEVIKSELGILLSLPRSLSGIVNMKEEYLISENNYEALREYILKLIK